MKIEELIVELLFHYNTALPSSAAIERLFSIGKDILKSKRCGLSDNHFEMIGFGKQLIVITAAFIVSESYFVWFQYKNE